jgi:hypothetical protein
VNWHNHEEVVMMVPAGSKVTSGGITPAPENPKVMVANKTVITVASNVVLTLASALDMAN